MYFDLKPDKQSLLEEPSIALKPFECATLRAFWLIANEEYDPPGYLYQPAEMNGHVLEYTALPGTSRINGGIHGGYGHSGPMLPQTCHHLHHKHPNGLALLNGSGGHFSPGHPHSHDGTLPHSAVDCEHSHPHPHPHHHHNGGGMYTALPQTESSDCMSCQNLCNNNRCYTKTNGTFSSGTLSLCIACSVPAGWVGDGPSGPGLDSVPPP
ncbi:cell adhesion molecule-related/down-regulated by oncogenes-like [Lampris incognitus]|uniref:cell adhesion molecule-related/down-regulated by oncogenes-like n=1 Tax=Lampris incognitus TaxID=2546036 RepID=UPI0024B515A9|nr:cell adhesion molecule-related/down-regulated by oncogenes-like [Lampris incognitus]